MGLEAALACTSGLTKKLPCLDSFIYKTLGTAAKLFKLSQPRFRLNGNFPVDRRVLKTASSCLRSLLLNYTAIYGSLLFQMNKDNSGNSIDLILVGKCPLSLIRL